MATERAPMLLLNGNSIRYRSFVLRRNLQRKTYAMVSPMAMQVVGHGEARIEVIDRAENRSCWRIVHEESERRRSGRVLYRLSVSPEGVPE